MADDQFGIDWASASVSNARLTVAFTGKPDTEWIERLGRVIERLGHAGSGWGTVEVEKKKLRVDDVSPGAESDLRHFLESAILQANADLAAAEDDDGGRRSGPDQEMTDAFRAFGDDGGAVA